MNIYLAGDSIVQNYTEEEFIAGWGQFLPRFFKSDVNVFNYAKGGRSSRLFINEGRFEEIDRHIQSGDYLFIEFCHNDDDSKDYKSMFNRQTPLGVPDESGRFPVIAGVKMPKNYIPPEYIEALNREIEEELNIKPINPELMGIYSGKELFNIYPKSKDQVYILNHVFFCEKFEGEINFTDGEVKDLKWFDLDNLPENIFKVNRPIINDVKKFVNDRKVIVN